LNDEMAMLARAHNNANVLSLASSFVPEAMAKKILDVWLATEFEGGRHARRLEKIEEHEK
jgi:ribose 5-phosphate isomerase B